MYLWLDRASILKIFFISKFTVLKVDLINVDTSLNLIAGKPIIKTDQVIQWLQVIKLE